ncbi:hypothetical protein [Amycolatopsis saalfeldensis]|uniref:Uncharacterized protein n=1 Tax=Amycolatopsis saalfeldensis TaxID=394193 RepID=A0A1H8YN83_9PSEU|nr:hypothetical protein [Amycolatopsis saalfeldensis]SEP53619.1 hypothetical protein SAMN04489732_12944 [Amycolatopsis saalfeldensis]
MEAGVNFAIVHVGDGRRDLTWRGPERDNDDEDIPGTETDYAVDLGLFDLPKLVGALIRAHARSHPGSVDNMRREIQSALDDHLEP